MERLKALAERWRWLGTALEVKERVTETNGGAMASATTIMFFLSIFPLLLVAISLVGFLAAGNEDLASDLVSELDLQDPAAEVLTNAIETAQESRRAASIIGLVGLAWSGLGVTKAITLAVRTPWQHKAKGLRSRLDGLVWLGGAVLTLGASLAAGALLNLTPEAVPRALTSLALVLVGLALELVFFTWTFWALGDRRTGWRPLLPGAVAAAIGFELLKLVGTIMVPRMVASSSSLYGPIGIVFALLVWLSLFSRLFVWASALNAVRWEAVHGTRTLTVEAIVFDDEEPPGADRGGAVLTDEDHPG